MVCKFNEEADETEGEVSAGADIRLRVEKFRCLGLLDTEKNRLINTLLNLLRQGRRNGSAHLKLCVTRRY